MRRLIHFPKTRLSEVVREFGGANRDDAVKGALAELESMRGQADQVIGESLAALEQTAAAPEDGARFSDGQMYQMLVICDQIVTLAGTFGYKGLDSATRYLCDLIDGLRGEGSGDVPSIRVHVRTMRLLAPGSPPLSAGHQDVVLEELAKILAHHGYSRAGETAERA